MTETLLFCFGRDLSGETNVPQDFRNDISFVSAGEMHTCAINNSKTLHCWGSNLFGQSIFPMVSFNADMNQNVK